MEYTVFESRHLFDYLFMAKCINITLTTVDLIVIRHSNLSEISGIDTDIDRDTNILNMNT